MLTEVGVATAVAAVGTSDDGMAWISLSDPATTADGEAEPALNREALANADMDWLDLSKASGEARPSADRQAQARADMDWLDLERSGDGPNGVFAPI